MEKWRAIDSGMGLDRQSISHESILHQGRFRADRSFILSHVGEKWRRGGRSTHKPSSFASRWMTTVRSDVLSLILAPFCIINLTRTLARLYSISGLERGVQRDAGKEREEEAKDGVPGCLCLAVSAQAALFISASSVSLVGILSICILPICKVDEVDALRSRRRARVCGAEQKWCRSRSRHGQSRG